jgi:hypothetical protein
MDRTDDVANFRDPLAVWYPCGDLSNRAGLSPVLTKARIALVHRQTPRLLVKLCDSTDFQATRRTACLGFASAKLSQPIFPRCNYLPPVD